MPRRKINIEQTRLNYLVDVSVRDRLLRLQKRLKAGSETEVFRRALEVYESLLNIDDRASVVVQHDNGETSFLILPEKS